MKIVSFYVGSSLLAPLRDAESEINRRHDLGLRVRAYNFGAALDESMWREVERDLSDGDIVFIFHVTDGENASRLIPLLQRHGERHRAVIVINCMPDLMRRTQMGKLRFGADSVTAGGGSTASSEAAPDATSERRARRLVKSVGAWMGEQVRSRRGKGNHGHTQYLRYVERLPSLLRFVPGAGRLRDVKHYLYLFSYFLQPTPGNIRSMLLYAVKHYAADERVLKAKLEIPVPETMPAVGLYHPDAPSIFKTFDAYRAWHERRTRRNEAPPLDPARTVGLLLMRPQIVSGTHRHYDGLIRAIEAEGLAVLPAISTFMDNREACSQFFVDRVESKKRKDDGKAQGSAGGSGLKSRVSQIVSLTGFSFVGGPAMNDSEAAVKFLKDLNRPFRSAVSLDVQTIESWRDSWTGL
ncbi:MAG: cobaltochelatase subunit CobN, partial [Acidobacteria bacterium]|nr:cobaltochelatase subunit CobN [Acidobacteriota bacterium]